MVQQPEHRFRDLLRHMDRFAPPRLGWRSGAAGQAWEPDLILVARMTHAFALATSQEHERARDITRAGIAALHRSFRDSSHGGWLARPGETRKQAYAHDFVLLAAASALRSGDPVVEPEASSLLRDALATIDVRFWNPELGVLRESFAVDWTDEEEYIGANANMHGLEALLAAVAATGDRSLLARGLRIADAIVRRQRERGNALLVEHFSPDLEPLLDYNRRRPAHPLRPYGSTVGHWLEWARLLVELDAAMESAPPWLLETAVALFDDAVRLGWQADGRPGFVYTLDWTARVSVASRLHWVLTEAIAAAWALADRTGDQRYLDWYREFWALADRAFIRPNGSWEHELNADLQPAPRVWQGRPDAYHASTALLAHRLRLRSAADDARESC